MAGMDKVFGAISAGVNESIRGLAGSTLTSGVPVDVGTSLLPKVKELTVSGSDDFSTTGTNQSERGQVLPSTTNKIPRIYGNVVTGGVVIDTHKPSANTVFVAMALSVTDINRYDYVANLFDSEDLGPAWGLYEIYRENFECEMQANVFTMGNAEPYGATASTVQTLVNVGDPTDNVSISSANCINVWAWQHTGANTNQIFPYYPPGSTHRQNAWDVMPNWTSDYTCRDLVTVIVKVDLNEAAGIEEFGTFKFKVGTRGYYVKQANGSVISIPLTNPAIATYDYAQRLGYGEFEVGIEGFDDASVATWRDYCNEDYYYALPTGDTDVLGGTFYNTYGSYDVYQTERWQINAFINTQNNYTDNLEELCKAGQGAFSYDYRLGKFRFLFDKPITNAEAANCFVFDNKNVTSAIDYNSTDLYSLYNYAECTFPNVLQQDLADVVIVKTPDSEKLNNELPSGMNFQVSTVNDRPRASQLANNSLKASRVANMASFEADFSTFEVEVGDFVKITESGKGWNEKIFRVLRITETQAEDGAMYLSYNCIEHRPSVYEDIIYVASANEPFGTGVGTVENLLESNTLTFTDQFSSYTPTLEAFVIADDPSSGNANVYHANGTLDYADTITNVLNNFGYTSSKANVYVDYSNEGWFMVSANTVGAPAFTNGKLTFTRVADDGDTPAYDVTENVVTYESGATPDNANIHNIFMATSKLADGDYDFEYNFYKQEQVRKRESVSQSLANVTINDRTATGNVLLDTYGPGTFLTQTVSTPVDNANANLQVLSTTSHKITNINQTDDFTLTYQVKTSWTSIQAGVDDVAFSLQGDITFVNASNTTTQVFPITGGGVQYNNITSTQAVQLLNRTNSYTLPFSGRASVYGLDADEWYPATANVTFVGYNTATNGTFTEVEYELRSENRFYR